MIKKWKCIVGAVMVMPLLFAGIYSMIELYKSEILLDVLCSIIFMFSIISLFWVGFIFIFDCLEENGRGK